MFTSHFKSRHLDGIWRSCEKTQSMKERRTDGSEMSPRFFFGVIIKLAMNNNNNFYSNAKQGFLLLLISDCLDLVDPVFTFDRFMEGIDLNKYLKNIPEHITGRVRYNPVNMLKTVLFGFMTSGCL